ncbi:DUF2017 family protein, partial [Streptomyces sp. NPDC056333]|uniref:DUF2017 family protein n=1 Tax=Streptomyces sp. NPDC056333 TaxID=3345786 RepID=UPI0035D72341
MITPITTTTGATIVQAYQWVDRARRNLLGGGVPVPAGEDGGILTLTADECRNWLGALNDLRLTIGT